MANKYRVNMDYLEREIYPQVAKDMGITVEEVRYTYMMFIKHLIDIMGEIDLSKDMTEEEFKQLRTNFNIPSVGKIGLPYDRFQYLRKAYINQKRIGKRYGRVQDTDD